MKTKEQIQALARHAEAIILNELNIDDENTYELLQLVNNIIKLTK